jgi:hypothetical protein
MKTYQLNEALQVVLMMFTKGYTRWVSFEISEEKLPDLWKKWAEIYGINLPAWKRFQKKARSLPNAWAGASLILGKPGCVQVMLMATAEVDRAPVGSPWKREKWRSDPPVLGDYYMIQEPRGKGDRVLTWRLKPEVQYGLQKYLTHLVKNAGPSDVARETKDYLRAYTLFGGVRRQLRRVLHGGRKLWASTHPKQAWPGPDPDHLPAMIGFRKTKADCEDSSRTRVSRRAVERPAKIATPPAP